MTQFLKNILFVCLYEREIERESKCVEAGGGFVGEGEREP